MSKATTDAPAEGRPEGQDPLAGLKIAGLGVSDGWLLARLTKKKLTDAPSKVSIYADGVRVGKVGNVEYDSFNVAEFSFLVPEALFDGKPHVLTLRDSRTEQEICPGAKNSAVTFQSDFLAMIEEADAEAISGYVSDPAPDGTALELYDGDRLLAAFPLGDRNAKAEVRLGCAPVWSFRIAPPRELYDGKAHHLRLAWKGQSIRARSGPRLTLRLEPPSAPEPKNRYASQVQELNCNLVRGHVFDTSSDRPVVLEVLVDGDLVGVVAADQYAPRLRSARHSGFHAFSYSFPSELMNGQERQVVLRVAGTEHALPTPGEKVLFPLVALRETDVTHESAEWLPRPRGRRFAERPIAPPRPTGLGPLLSMIVLNWNGAHVLQPFLESLARTPFRDAIEVILVDHGSTDGSTELIREFASRLDIRPIFRGANYSFSESNNLGATQARGDYLVFANNDLVFVEDCLSRMRDVLDANADVGVVGAKLLEPRYRGAGRWAMAPHHLGVTFDVSAAQGRRPRAYFPKEIVGRDDGPDYGVAEEPAVTAALAIVRKRDFEAAGGFELGYQYGYEDVDLAMSLRRVGLKAVCDRGAVAIHNRSATRERKGGGTAPVGQGALYVQRAADANRALFFKRFARFLPRRILDQLLSGEPAGWRKAPLRVTFVVTETDMSTAAGDYFTAHELGLSLRKLFGWEVMFVQHKQFDLAGTDVLIVMRHDYDLGRVVNTNPGFVAVAWTRNRLDQWLSSPHFGKYHVLLASSRKAVDLIEQSTGRKATLFPIATNAERFGKGRDRPDRSSDVCFTGHYWGAARQAVDVLDPRELPYSFAIWGQRWNEHPLWGRFWRGRAPYWELPDIYASAKLVIDDSHPVTREWNSLNSRVFDVLAAGRLVLTNCVGGAQELFEGKLPSFSTQEELRGLIKGFMDDPEGRERLAQELREEVLRNHTYDVRAHALQEVLLGHARRPGTRIAIKAPIPDHGAAHKWGDQHFALALKRSLEKLGHQVRIDILPEWYGGLTAGDEVVIVLRGLSKYEPQPNAVNLLWLISHPDEVTVAEMKGYDHVFVASESLARRLQARLGEQVSTLLQCADPDLLRPAPEGEAAASGALFVGNSRAQRRKMVDWAIEAGLKDLAVYGDGWKGRIPESAFKGEHVPNEALYRHYSGAGAVLNDHWPDMAEEGFISNRLFDAAACGAWIITDPIQGLKEVFGDLVVECRSKDELKPLVEKALAAKDRRKRGEALRALVLKHHTFDHRAATIMEVVERIRGATSWRSPSRTHSKMRPSVAATPA